ncbi:MAG: hypothetical protein RBR68_11385 [Tenuifilaceae bacterium]|nr:hypothetical protein [Tenuifilaceae bacterium]
MNNYAILEEKYKHLFEQDKHGSILRGIECGTGWYNHVEKFLESLEWIRTHNLHLNNNDSEEFHYISIFQIKEKFGECRCYVSHVSSIDNQVSEAVGSLTGKCSITCEKCGKLEYDCIKSNGYWIYCLCSKCYSELKQ